MRFHRIDSESLAAALAQTPLPFVLDVRSAAAFAAARVPGSRHVPVHELASRRRDLPGSRVARIVVVGDPGKRTAAAASWLALMGYADVAVLDGGFPAWRGDVEAGA